MEESINETIARLSSDGYYTEIKLGDKLFFADEPLSIGGTDLAPTPMNYLLGALVSCTAITIKMYAKRKGWDIGEINVQANLIEAISADGRKVKINKTLEIENPLTIEQMERLLLIGSKCPVSKMLESGVEMGFELK